MAVITRATITKVAVTAALLPQNLEDDADAELMVLGDTEVDGLIEGVWRVVNWAVPASVSVVLGTTCTGAAGRGIGEVVEVVRVLLTAVEDVD